mgnify:CR=1 FL=1
MVPDENLTIMAVVLVVDNGSDYYMKQPYNYMMMKKRDDHYCGYLDIQIVDHHDVSYIDLMMLTDVMMDDIVVVHDKQNYYRKNVQRLVDAAVDDDYRIELFEKMKMALLFASVDLKYSNPSSSSSFVAVY